ncbi:MAG: hypothetical protein AAF146_00745 [Bacteroidota bacterium]
MLSRLLYLPFVAAMIISLYLTFEVDEGYSWYIIPPVVALSAIYFLSPQIDWWWYLRHPPVMNQKLSELIHRMNPFYAALSPEDKKRFQDRVELYVRANAYISKGIKEDGVPPDEVVYFVATCITQLTFGLVDFRLPLFERIVIYPAPFPSPQFPEHIHASEIFAEDGVLIFAVHPLMEGIIRPDQYNIGFHEYAQAFIVSYPDAAYARREEVNWEILEAISGFSEEKIRKTIGLDLVDQRAVCIHHFFHFARSFREHLPDLYERHRSIFNLDPLRAGSPIVDRRRGDGPLT